MELMNYVDSYVQWLIIYGLGFLIYFARPAGIVSLLDPITARLSKAFRRPQPEKSA
jgi:hypothetical protein